MRLFSSIHIMYLAIDIVYVYRVLYRSIYHFKGKGSYGGSNTQYSGAVRGAPRDSNPELVNLFKPNLGSFIKARNLPLVIKNTNMSFNGNR